MLHSLSIVVVVMLKLRIKTILLKGLLFSIFPWPRDPFVRDILVKTTSSYIIYARDSKIITTPSGIVWVSENQDTYYTQIVLYQIHTHLISSASKTHFRSVLPMRFMGILQLFKIKRATLFYTNCIGWYGRGAVAILNIVCKMYDLRVSFLCSYIIDCIACNLKC